MSSKKLPISALPLPPPAHILTHNLTADASTPAARTFPDVLRTNPSVQRRSRVVPPPAHFSHVAPLPLPFPYEIVPPDGEEVTDKAAFVEQWLSAHEALAERPSAPAPQPGALKKYSADTRDMPRELLALSDTGLRDCVPHLAVGDAFALLGAPRLALADDEEERTRYETGEQAAVREELVDVLSGHSVLMAVGEQADVPYAPWALRYSGHQFGNWAGQLGDGRAISILEAQHPTEDLSYELQLKGAGRTPYSRTADGLAVLRSSIREYLCAEAMHALRIPTTRSLALIHLPDLPVLRETRESACVLTRSAPSFVRVGSFQALSPPTNMFFLGGGQQPADWDALRVLGVWVTTRVLRLGLGEAAPWGKALVFEAARRNARMVAGWQAYGFMHGVINTDNVSIMGLTIDYGPYAFMDIFDPHHICNHTDAEGRYAYKYQPTMIVYAMRALLASLAPLIGAEAERGAAVLPGWAAGADDAQLAAWRLAGMALEQELKAEIERVHAAEYWALMRKRLGLRTEEDDDADKVVRLLLDLLQAHHLDFHTALRRLCAFRPSLLAGPAGELDKFIESLCEVGDGGGDGEAQAQARADWRAWLSTFGARVAREAGAWGAGEDGEAARAAAARCANPRFVLRQWLLEEVIQRVLADTTAGRRALAKVHEMAVRPFEAWGGEDDVRADGELDEEVREERRFCGLGAKRMLGFQCSCSS